MFRTGVFGDLTTALGRCATRGTSFSSGTGNGCRATSVHEVPDQTSGPPTRQLVAGKRLSVDGTLIGAWGSSEAHEGCRPWRPRRRS